jgi:hypothetical protein
MGSPSMRDVLLVERKRQRTLYPLSTRVCTTDEPKKPLPPVTKTRMIISKMFALLDLYVSDVLSGV